MTFTVKEGRLDRKALNEKRDQERKEHRQRVEYAFNHPRKFLNPDALKKYDAMSVLDRILENLPESID